MLPALQGKYQIVANFKEHKSLKNSKKSKVQMALS